MGASRRAWAGMLVAMVTVAGVQTGRGAETRTVEEIGRDLNASGKALQEVMPSLTVLGDPEGRQAIAAKATPILKKMVGLFGEMAGVQRDPAEKAGLLAQRADYESYLVALGDAETEGALEKTAKSDDAAGLQATSALAVGNWLNRTKDAAAQRKILDGYAAVVKAHPADGGVMDSLSTMWHLGAASDDLKRKVADVARADAKPEVSRQLLSDAAAWESLKGLEGKPLALSGRTATGGTFDSTSWKGKVVLVDFWATWCVPCRAELPHVKALYSAYHDKGFEVVGVDCDDSDEPVNSFVKENGMPWPQMRESTTTDDGWHPLTKQLHVTQLPTMFMIDKKGVLRFVEAGNDLEGKIKALLAEGT